MPLRAVSAVYGHKAIFQCPSSAPTDALFDIDWGPTSITVPYSSVLNGPAHVWLRIPNVNIAAAERWCYRENVRFLSAWRPAASAAPQGFGFAVPGFSRYRYVESESDDELGHEEGPEMSRDERRRARVRSAGRTPARKKVADASDTTPHPASDRPLLEEEEDGTLPYARPRMATPRTLLADDDTMAEADEDEDEDKGRRDRLGDGSYEDQETDSDRTESTDPADGIPHAAEIFRPPTRRRGLMNADTPKMQRQRAALFENLPTYAADRAQYSNAIEVGFTGREEEAMADEDDVNMEDVPSGEFEDLRDAEENRFRMFESPRRPGLGQEAEDYMNREAGDFVKDGTVLVRRWQSEAFFPEASLPFPTVDDTIAANKEGVFTDTGLMLCRSTQISVSHSGLMVRPNYGVTQMDAFSVPGFAVDVQDIYRDSTPVPRSVLAMILRVHCTTWYTAFSGATNSKQNGPSPTQETGKALRIRVPSLKESFRHSQVADATIEQFIEGLKSCHRGGDNNALHAQVALWMLLALYKKEEDFAFRGGNTLLKRIAVWAGGPAGTAFDADENCLSEGLRSALLCLSLGKIEDAVSIATESGHLRLALLIARALESPKDELRADAEAQLASYGLREQFNFDSNSQEDNEAEQWDQLLEDCREDSAVSIDERMILLVLAGHIAPVARFLGLSWYRLFIMELCHGAGSSELTQAERVSSAVEAVSKAGIPTRAPHGYTEDRDVVYHLLRLYADPTASYSLTSGVYSNGSFGSVYSPLDSRFSWLMYQVLSGLIPQASTPRAPQKLADEFSSQLRAAGLHLWSFYVLCSGGAPADVIKRSLIRDWPNMASDFVEWAPKGSEPVSISGKGKDAGAELDAVPNADNFQHVAGQLNAEVFLVCALGVPREWVSEAKAVAAHVAGTKLEECEHWIVSGTDDGASYAHEVLAKEVFPEMVASQDSSRYGLLLALLKKLETSRHVPNWSMVGGLILSYLEYVAGVPEVKTQPLEAYRGMVGKVRSWAAMVTTPAQHHAVSVIADGIAAAERAHLFDVPSQERSTVLEQLVEDLERLPCTRDVKLRIAGEYRIEAEHGHAVALRFSAAYPPYVRFLKSAETAADS